MSARPARAFVAITTWSNVRGDPFESATMNPSPSREMRRRAHRA